MASVVTSVGRHLHCYVFLFLVVLLRPCGAASTLSTFWQHELPRAAIPASFKNLASPLSAEQTQHYLAALRAADAPAYRSNEFCSSAGIYCPQKAVTVVGPDPRVCIPPFLYSYGDVPCDQTAAAMASAIETSGDMFFSQASLAVGKIIKLPNTANDLHGLRFLPDSLTRSFPELNEHNMPTFAKFYGIKDGSDMQFGMKVSLAHCGYKSEHELKTCHVSGESMVSFIAKTVGHDAAAYVPPLVTLQEAIIVDMSVRSFKGGKVASCHDMQFPSLLYSCHMTQTSEVMDVTLKLADGSTAHLPAICHMDTSYWNPSHMAFQVLKVEPGKSAVCHWFPENSFIFVQGAM